MTPSNYGMLVTPLCLASAPAVLQPRSDAGDARSTAGEADMVAAVVREWGGGADTAARRLGGAALLL